MSTIVKSGFGNIPFLNCNKNLETAVLEYEGYWIKQALQMCDGNATEAAKMLGLTRQGLDFIIGPGGRHEKLLQYRTERKTRKRKGAKT